MAKTKFTLLIRAEELCHYVMIATINSPRAYRFTFAHRLQNLAITILEDVYYANDIYVSPNNPESYKERLKYQRKIITNAKLLAFLANSCIEIKVLTFKQYENIGTKCNDIMNLTGAWIKSANSSKEKEESK